MPLRRGRCSEVQLGAEMGTEGVICVHAACKGQVHVPTPES